MTTSVTTRAAGKLNPTRQQLDELDALLQRMLDLPVQPPDKSEQAKPEEPVEEPPPRKEEGGRQKEEKEAPITHPSSSILPPSGTPPVSYMFVETASPRPLPAASGFEPRPPMLTPRLVPVTPPPEMPASPPPVQEASEGEEWVPLRSTWQPSAQTWPPLAESWHQANSGAPAATAPGPIDDPRPNPMPPPSAERTITVELPASETLLGTPNAEYQTPEEPQVSLPDEDAPVVVSWPLLPLVWFNQGFDACLAPLGVPGHWLSGRGRAVFGYLGLACLAAAAAIAVGAGMGWSW